MYDIYIAGKLTKSSNLEKQKKFYESIAKIAKKTLFSVYVPHKHTDPIKHANISAEKVYNIDSEIVANAKIIIAYVGEPSLGVGTELEIAKNNKTKIILLFHKDCKVSRMALGNPGVTSIIKYSSIQDALNQLEILLTKIKQE